MESPRDILIIGGIGIKLIGEIFVFSFIVTAINFTIFDLWKKEYKLYFKCSMNLGTLIILGAALTFFIRNYE